MPAISRPLILTYHSISDGPPPLAIGPALFRDQMKWLAANARVLPLAQLVQFLIDPAASPKDIPRNAIILTFDDALADFYSNAAEIILRLGLPSTVFVPTGLVGGVANWDGARERESLRHLMTWPQIRELAGQGVAFGTHSLSHPRLDRLAPDEAEREIVGCKEALRSELGMAADFFCYPYGHWNSAVRLLASRHYRGACSTSTGAVKTGTDIFALPRVDVHLLRQPSLFRLIVSDHFRLYLGARRMVRRARGMGVAS